MKLFMRGLEWKLLRVRRRKPISVVWIYPTLKSGGDLENGVLGRWGYKKDSGNF